MRKYSGIEYRISYAQNREDIILNGFLGKVKKGFYVDVGANHPIQDSVTYLFYKKDWHGINIEPIQGLYDELVSLRPRDINLKLGVGSKRGKLTLRQYNGREGLSTFSNEMKSEYTSHHKDGVFEDVEVPVRPLKEILKGYEDTDLHFMKIDVEGFEQEVIEGNDWNKFRPWLLCIEANHIFQPWQAILEENQYQEVFFDGLNKYFLAKEHSKLLTTFSYPEAMLSRPIVTPEIDEALRTQGEIEYRFKHQIDIQQTRINELTAHINSLEHQIRESRRLKPAVKQTLKAIDNAIVVRLKNNEKKRRHSPLAADFPDAGVDMREVDELLKTIRVSDFGALYTLKGHFKSTEGVAYRAYHTATRRSFHTLRAVKHKLKPRR